MGRTRKSKRKLNSIYMMLLLTTIFMIVSTYAWFSANREVSITGITAKVAAAEGLQISIDGVKWGSSVTVDADTLEDVNETASINDYTWAEELEPVSADGTITDGALDFYYGEISANGETLSGVQPASAASGKYIVFDIFLKNSSSNASGDKLQLATGSSIAINADEGGKENTGLENCVRAAVLLYDNSTTFTAPLGNLTTATDASSGAKTIAGLLPGDNPKVAFWEPNYNQHIGEVVQNDDRISASNTVFPTLAITGEADGKNIKYVNSDDVDDGLSVDLSGVAVAAHASDDPYMAIPNTIETGAIISGSDIDLTDVTASETQLMLEKNSIMKAKVYIWLEGQDPDCIDTASTGRAFDIQINLCKPAKNQASAATP
ncbi:MAG: hypothetical protein IKP28_05600 [Clostridia bacterium]|nr:hypothetical protein [Clostridia bacterium]